MAVLVITIIIVLLFTSLFRTGVRKFWHNICISILFTTPQTSSGNLTRDQKLFNQKLYRTRVPVDAALHTLRRRWQRLKCLEMDEVTSMTQLVKCCCILHNICINNPGYMTTNESSATIFSNNASSSFTVSNVTPVRNVPGMVTNRGFEDAGCVDARNPGFTSYSMKNYGKASNPSNAMANQSMIGNPSGSMGAVNNSGMVEVIVENEDKGDLEVEYVGTQSLSSLQKRDMLAMYLSGRTLTLNIQ